MFRFYFITNFVFHIEILRDCFQEIRKKDGLKLFRNKRN